MNHFVITLKIAVIVAVFALVSAPLFATDAYAGEKGNGKPHHRIVLAQCVTPEPSVAADIKSLPYFTPAHKVTMEDTSGRKWNAFVDHQWSDFYWKPGTFLYAEAYRKELNQQVLFDIEARCEELAGSVCRTTDVSEIDPNPRIN